MTDYTHHYDSGEQPASYPPGIVDPDQSAGEQVNKSLTRSQLDYALKYASMGWPVIPCTWIWEHAGEKRCSCNKADCDSPGKHPIGKLTPHGLKDATTDPETIRKWWGEYPNANIAVVTGETSGIVAVDIDTHKGGQAAFDQWIFENKIQLPETVTQQTGSGGLHYVFRYPAGLVVGNRTDMLKGVDVRGQNGYIMVEPSCNLGGPYAWIDGEPWDSEIAELPQKLLELIGGKQKVGSGAAPSAGTGWIIPEETVQEVIDALRFIPADLYQRGIDPRTGREILGWIEIGHALKMMGLGERGFQIWDDWSKKSSKYDPKVMRSKWRSFGPTDITHLSIFRCAQDLGWQNPGAGSSGGAVSFNPETGEINPADLARQYNAVMADAAMAPATVEIDLDKEPVQDPAATAMESIERGIPNELMRFPVPILNRIADWMGTRAEDTFQELSVIGTLSLGSVIAGRIYRSTSNNCTAMFNVAIAGPGVGKNYVKESIDEILDESGLGGLNSGSGYTSPGALISTLYTAPTHITIIDELGNKLAEARRQSGGDIAATFSVLKEAFSGCNGILKPKNYSTMGLTKKQRSEVEKRPIKSPSITLLGLSTPDQFFSEIKYSEIEDGFLNRLLVVSIDKKSPKQSRAQPSQDPVPDDIIRWVRRVRRWDAESTPGAGMSMAGVDRGYDERPIQIPVEFEPSALALYAEFKKDLEVKSEDLERERLHPLLKRTREKAMRIGTILAVWENPDKPIIKREHAAWSIKYALYHDERLIESVRNKVYETEHEKVQNEFYAAILAAGLDGVSGTDLNRNKPFKAQKLRDRQEIIATLAAAGRIKKVKVTRGGRPRESWIATAILPKETLQSL